MNLTIEKLTKSFGEKQALNIDHYAIHSGETIGLVGNNGAGKTTLFRIILDLLHADTGCVTIDGVVDGQPVSCDTSKSEAWKAYTGAFVDTGFLIDYLTPEEYFRFIAKISGISDAVMHDRLLQFDGFMNGCVFANLKDTVLHFRVNDDFYNRRNGWKRAKQMLRDRMKMNKALGYDISANLFALGMFCMTVSPSWVKKILYKIR